MKRQAELSRALSAIKRPRSIGAFIIIKIKTCKMAKKRKSSKGGKRKGRAADSPETEPLDADYSEEEEAPVPMRLVAFTVFLFILLVLATGFF